MLYSDVIFDNVIITELKILLTCIM